MARHSVSFVRGRSSTSITARRTCPCRCSHSIGSERNICCPQSWRAAKFLMQISEHPTDLFAGPAAVDPVFLSQGDGFGIVVAVVAASRNLSLGRQRTFRESLLVGKFMVGSCQGACPVIPSLDTGLWLQQPFAAPPTPSVEPAPWPPPRDIAGAAAPEARPPIHPATAETRLFAATYPARVRACGLSGMGVLHPSQSFCAAGNWRRCFRAAVS
jgi:hypothetical protein